MVGLILQNLPPVNLEKLDMQLPIFTVVLKGKQLLLLIVTGGLFFLLMEKFMLTKAKMVAFDVHQGKEQCGLKCL